MKLNWGHYILIAFIAFVGLILFMVVKSYQFDNDLVSEDYYAKELKYQEIIEKKKRAAALEEDVNWSLGEEGIVINYPRKMGKIEGNIYLYRPSDKSLDVELKIKPDSSSSQLIANSEIQWGKYLLQIDWSANSVLYFTEGVVFVSE